MTEDQSKTETRADGPTQADPYSQPRETRAGEAWVKAVAASAIPDRAWTLSRIDSTLGSIA